jgi:hypothetical protein
MIDEHPDQSYPGKLTNLRWHRRPLLEPGDAKTRRSGSKSGSGRWSQWDEIGWVHYPEIGWSHSGEIRWVQSLEILHLNSGVCCMCVPSLVDQIHVVHGAMFELKAQAKRVR